MDSPLIYRTRNCIICGKKLHNSVDNPSAYTGHVLIDDLIVVSAGVCYNRKCDRKLEKKKAVQGCFGIWKPKYGKVTYGFLHHTILNLVGSKTNKIDSIFLVYHSSPVNAFFVSGHLSRLQGIS